MTNQYQTNLRNFAQGNITEENIEGNFKMIRTRLPKYVFDELSILALRNNVKVGRIMIEILRRVADRQIEKRKADEANLAELE